MPGHGYYKVASFISVSFLQKAREGPQWPGVGPEGFGWRVVDDSGVAAA